jgi:steroid 5-alpha reductase family enzyme
LQAAWNAAEGEFCVSLFNLILMSGLFILGMMTVLWIISLAKRDASIVDSFWGLGFVLTAWLGFALSPQGFPERRLLIVLLVSAWGLRLALHILRRNWGKGEDFRYAAWRQEHGGAWWWRSFFQVFVLQGVLMWLISLPLLAGLHSPQPAALTLLDWLALPVWGMGFFFETVGDWQLERFKADPASRGKVLDHGLWRYSRHPNYFGDAAQWWAFFLPALATGAWWTFFSPLLMTYLLVQVSGVALLERSLAERKPGYREYMETTSAFIPWPPRRRP